MSGPIRRSLEAEPERERREEMEMDERAEREEEAYDPEYEEDQARKWERLQEKL